MTKKNISTKNSFSRVSVPRKVVRQKFFPSKLKRSIRQIHPAVFILWAVVLIYFGLTFSALYQRYLYMEMSEANDSASFIQVSWSVLKGTPFTATTHDLSPDISHNALGTQLNFTLALFSPVFLFTTSAVPFLVIQSLIISLAAIPLYFFAGLRLKNKWLALLIATAYLFNPATYGSFNIFGWRPETLFIPAFFAMFYFLEKDNYWGAGISLMFAMFTKHNIIPIAFMLGLYYLIFDRKRWRFGSFCILLAVGYYVVGVRMIMYKFQMHDTVSFKHFTEFGQTPGEVFINIATHPGKIWAAISPGEWKFSRLIFWPAGILALFHPIFWVCLSQLVMNALQTDYHSIHCAWHWAVVVPFLFAGMVYSMGWLMSKFQRKTYLKYILGGVLALELLFNSAFYNKTVLNASKNFFYKRKNLDTSTLIDQLSIIEPDASVMSSAQLLWFLAARRHIYTSRKRFHDEVDYIAVLPTPKMRGYLKLDRKLLQETSNPASKYRNKFKPISNSPNLLILKNINKR